VLPNRRRLQPLKSFHGRSLPEAPEQCERMRDGPRRPGIACPRPLPSTLMLVTKIPDTLTRNRFVNSFDIQRSFI
jgi:hypothetical protein